MDRRQFLSNAALGSMAIAVPARFINHSKEDIEWPAFTGNVQSDVVNEAFWEQLRQHFDLPTNYTNLENGYFSLMPKSTLEYHQEREKYVNSHNSYFMRREQEAAWLDAKSNLSTFLGVTNTELVLTRNTTESLNIIIAGYPWKKGDEVVIGNQDYGSMVAAFLQAEKRHRIKVKTASIPLLPKDDAEIIDAYFTHVTKKTKVIHVTHLINITGQVLPVKAICQEAHKRGIEVMVDAAHSNAHIVFKLPELEADYVGASLHKWLQCPLGTGFLWMKKQHISKIWPLMADNDYPANDIRKFEHQGTRPVHTFETISKAIDFQNRIGSVLKEQRLKYLSKKLCAAIANTQGIHIHTPWQDENRNSAIVNIGVDGYTPAALAQKLLTDYGIFTVAIDLPSAGLQGVRITPHLYTSANEMLAMAEALKKISVS